METTTSPSPYALRGIAGLTGREPIACALTVGRKGDNGAPIEKDRFHVLVTDAEQREYNKRDGGTYKAPARAGHPLFMNFNGADVGRRRNIPAQLAHVTVNEMFEYRRQAQKFPASGGAAALTHPKLAAVCVGNGVEARRWNGHDYSLLPCPGDQCPYAQAGMSDRGPTAAPCKPWMRFIARFDWPAVDGKHLPNVPFKFTSGSWNTVKNFLGFFDAFNRACQGFGVDPDRVPLFGLPVLLTLSEPTNVEAKSRFPVVGVQMAGEGDLIEWISMQLQRGAEVRRLASASAPLALTDSAMHTPEVIAADYDTIIGPGLHVPSAK